MLAAVIDVTGLPLAASVWLQLPATAIGGLIAVFAAWLVDLRKARAEAKARKRLARGSVRAWRDDLYQSEEVLAASIKGRRWDPARRASRRADVEDYKAVSREASWMTWGRLTTAQHRLDRAYRERPDPRTLDDADLEGLGRLLLLAEDARLRLARELDEDEPETHHVLNDPDLRHLQSSSYAAMLAQSGLD